MSEGLPIEPAHSDNAGTATPSGALAPLPQSQPVPQTVVMPGQNRFTLLLAIFAGLFLLMLVVGTIGFAYRFTQTYRSDQANNPSAPQEGSPDNAPAPATPATTGSPTSAGNGSPNTAVDLQRQQLAEQRRRELAAKQREDAARRQGQLIAFKAQIQRIRQDLTALQTSATEWTTEQERLLEGAQGRRLAGSAAHVERFVAIVDKTRLTTNDIRALQSRLDVLEQPLKSAQKEGDTSYVPSQTLRDELKELQKAISPALQQYRQDLRAVAGLLAETSRQEPAADTLQAAIKAFRQAEAAKRATVVAAARRKAQQEMTRKLAAAEKARIDAEAKVKLLKIQTRQSAAEAEQKRLAKLAAEQARAKQAAADKAALRREFERVWPQWKSFMTPYTSAGYTQPTTLQFRRTTEKGPVSLGKLRGAGMLTKKMDSLKSLYYATSAYGMNDRPIGGFPRYIGGARDWAKRQETVQRVQDFLNKYGEIMVEKKLLAP